MTKIRSTKNALISAILVLCMCFTGLLGTTFAWFTDSVTSSGNKIVAGTLKVDLELMDKNGNWKSLKRESAPIFESEQWEPGHTEVKILKVENEGSLALSWKTVLTKYSEISALAEVIDVYVRDYGVLDDAAASALTYPQDRTLAGYTLVGTAAEFLSTMEATTKGFLEAEQSAYLGLALKMRESADNKYQGLSLGGTFDITVLATQGSFEEDSFDNSYDNNAAADFFPGFQGGSATIPVTVDDQGLTTVEASEEGGDTSVVIPAGVMTNGASSLKLNVTLKDDSESNIQLSENEKMRPVDVHIDGVAAGNTTAMIVTLKHYLATGLNSSALKLYHVENGATVAMTHTATPTNHNEFYYDPSTGDLTMALASFSEVAVVADENNPWNGTSLDYTWYDATAKELTISNADQLAGFAAIVDGKAEGIAQDSFEGKTVKLNNNIYLDDKLFDPIGWGYVDTQWNRDGAAGKVFQGTFDGGEYDENGKLVGKYTIFGLFQDGYDLEASTGTDYTTTNCGFGLFAAASGATFRNLVINGARVRVECVEAGVLVGLSQNNCTYENIEIHDSKIANYQRPAGGLIGEVSGDGTTTITNVTIGSDVVVGSLWGDFDAPCGGVIGAYWNDVNANPQIEMKNVEVGARLDVYNDLTSAYQWHSYRRAGMLIGNTELTDPDNAHKAYAPFLTCTKDGDGNPTVKVYYGDWVNYTYCEFSNHNSRYPWVRTQAGENCEAFSNPRWGVPNDINGVKVTPEHHHSEDTSIHEEGDGCYVLRQFSQLYGGGQGVYGQDKHDGVETIDYKYSITYINDGKVLDIIYVTNNSEAFGVANDQAKKLVDEWATKNMTAYENWQFGGWMNAASIKLTEIPKDNTKNIVLYPYFDSPYTASFVDQQGNILDWCFFNEKNTNNLSGAFATAKEKLPNPGADFTLIEWKVKGKDKNDKDVNTTITTDNADWTAFKGYKDVTITPHYRYNGADLIEVVDELTGEVDHYQVAGYTDGVGSALVEIPAYVNGKPVTTVNENAFSSYDDLHSIRIPGTITSIGYQSFTANQGSSWNPKRDTVTIYYEGDPAVWNAEMEKYVKNHSYGGMFANSWDNMMGAGSRVFFLDANGKVINTMYWELNSDFEWVLHEHAYTYEAAKGCAHGANSHYEYSYKFLQGSKLWEEDFTDYDGNCSCNLGTHERPDAEYWTTTPATTEE